RLPAPVEIGGDDSQRNGQSAEIVGHRFGQELLAEFLRVHQRGTAETDTEQVGESAGSRGNQPAPDLAATVGERDHVASEIPAGQTGGVGSPDQRADRGAGDRDRLGPDLVERLEHGDVREAAGPAATERERNALAGRRDLAHCAPASRAKAQALTASGCTSGAMAAAFSLVAVPSRTRPTMPCRIAARRKKL